MQKRKRIHESDPVKTAVKVASSVDELALRDYPEKSRKNKGAKPDWKRSNKNK